MAIYNVGERDIGAVRVILASFGIFAANMVDIDAMGIPDPEGHTRHIDDWKSSDGRKKSKAESHCPIWGFEGQATYRNMVYEGGPLEAWNKIEGDPQIVKFLGGERCKPGPNQGVVQLVMGRCSHPKIPCGVHTNGLGNCAGRARTRYNIELVPGRNNCSDEEGPLGGEH
jgi:hypothetical protein